MEFRRLGDSGLKVPVLCLGTMTFGQPDEKSFMHNVACDEDTAFRIMDRAVDAGVNFFDTADVYGNEGLTEKVIGRWFEKSGKRDRVILASKFRFRMAEGPNGTGASRHRIRRAIEESLKRLRTDRLELYQVHMQDLDTPEEETLRALDDLVRAGKVLYLGASNYAAYRLVESVMTSRAEGLHRFVALQAQYSLVVRDIEREHVPACRRHGMGILPWSPLAGGFLSGKFQRNAPPPPGTRLAKHQDRLVAHDTERNWRIVEALDGVAREKGATVPQVAMAWLLRKPAVTSVIFGARSMEQLEDNLKAADVKLDDESMKKLDAASALEIGYPYEFMAKVQKAW